jgi:hypothetical protein
LRGVGKGAGLREGNAGSDALHAVGEWAHALIGDGRQADKLDEAIDNNDGVGLDAHTAVAERSGEEQDEHSEPERGGLDERSLCLTTG